MPRRPWRTPRLPALVGVKGTCQILGIQKMTLNRWMRPGSGNHESCHGPEKTYMIEPRRVDQVDEDETLGWPVWVREDVERFRDEIGRQRAPASTREAASR